MKYKQGDIFLNNATATDSCLSSGSGFKKEKKRKNNLY